MKLLLDTHVFLWFISGDDRLPSGMRDSIRDTDNEVFLSVASLWEAMIKFPLGKLPLPEPPGTYLPKQRERHSISSLRRLASITYPVRVLNAQPSRAGSHQIR